MEATWTSNHKIIKYLKVTTSQKIRETWKYFVEKNQSSLSAKITEIFISLEVKLSIVN